MVAGDDGAESPQRILIVDDERGVRDLLDRWLTHNGFVVETAADAGAALARMAEAQPDLVITDMMMPGMDGGQLMGAIATAYPSLPTVIITGNPEVQTAVQLIKNGAADYILKPFDLHDILAKVKQVIAEARRKRQDAYVGTIFGMDLERVGDYLVEGVLGEGANGVVFRATKDGESVRGQWVIKALKLPGESNGAARQSALARFRYEGRVGELISHPGIVRIVATGVIGDGAIPYLVMPFIEGESLAQMIARGASGPEFSAHVLVQLADALAAVHGAGVVHRDLKPGNVMVDDKGSVTLMDFSIARVPDSDLTRADMILGSPAYMAPEAFLGSLVDYRADLFSLGVVGYELATGERPFSGDTLARFSQTIPIEKPRRPSSLNPAITPDLEGVLAALLRKRPEQRPGSAKTVAEALRGGGIGAALADDWTDAG